MPRKNKGKRHQGAPSTAQRLLLQAQKRASETEAPVEQVELTGPVSPDTTNRAGASKPVAQVRPEPRLTPPPARAEPEWETVDSDSSDGVQIVVDNRGLTTAQLGLAVRLEAEIRAAQGLPMFPSTAVWDDGEPMQTETPPLDWDSVPDELVAGADASNVTPGGWADEEDEEAEVVLVETEAMEMEDTPETSPEEARATRRLRTLRADEAGLRVEALRIQQLKAANRRAEAKAPPLGPEMAAAQKALDKREEEKKAQAEQLAEDNRRMEASAAPLAPEPEQEVSTVEIVPAGPVEEVDDPSSLPEEIYRAGKPIRTNRPPTNFDFKVVRAEKDTVLAKCRKNKELRLLIDRTSLTRIDDSPIVGDKLRDFREVFRKGDRFTSCRSSEVIYNLHVGHEIADIHRCGTNFTGPVLVRTGVIEMDGPRKRVYCPELEQNMWVPTTNTLLREARRHYTVAFRHDLVDDVPVSGCEMGVTGEVVPMHLLQDAHGALLPVLFGPQLIAGVCAKHILCAYLHLPPLSANESIRRKTGDKVFLAIVGPNIRGRRGRNVRDYRCFGIVGELGKQVYTIPQVQQRYPGQQWHLFPKGNAGN